MSVVEAPTVYDWPVLAHGLQKYGHFVFFRIDPLASVAVLDDAEASRAAALLPQDWFLGIVMQTGGVIVRNAKGRLCLNLNIFLLGDGPAEPISAATPIFPAPQVADDHPPIRLPSELPWPNLYAHSFNSVTVVITRIHDGPYHFPVSLTDEQNAAFLDLSMHDQYCCHDAVRNKPAQEARAPTAAEKSAEARGPEGSVAGSDSSRESNASDAFMFSDEVLSITDRFMHRRTYAELWLDPESCPGQPAPPSACQDVLTRLGRISKGWYARKIEEAKTRRPRQIREWTETVGDAAEHHSADDMQVSEPEPAEDDDILPEDAVDDRAERERSEHPSGRPRQLSPAGPSNDSEPPSSARADAEGARTAPVDGPTAPSEGNTEGSNAMPHIKVATLSTSTTLLPPATDSSAAQKFTLASKTSIVRERVTSMKKGAVKWFRSLVGHLKPQTVRAP